MNDPSNHFRGRRRTTDGIINAPTRNYAAGRPFGDVRRHPVVGDTLKTDGRMIGDFNRPQGYHVSNDSIGSQQFNARPGSPAPQPAPLMNVMPSVSDTTTSEAGDRVFGGRRERAKQRGRGGWHRVRKYALRTGIIGVVLVLVLGGVLLTKGYFKLHQVFKGGGSAIALRTDVDPALLKGEGDGRVNMLLLGRGGEGHTAADLTDTILVASVDPVNYKAELISVPRDMWVTTSSGSMKINAVFSTAKQKSLKKGANRKTAELAGVEAAKEEVTKVLGIPIHYYGMLDFKAFKDAVDTVGGVDIMITEDTAVYERLWDPTTSKTYVLNVKPGMQHFDGQRALFYARSRHTSPRGDFDRAERQRLLIQALANKVASAGTYSNPVKISQLMDTFGEHIATDMSIEDGLRLLAIGQKIGTKFTSLDLADPKKPLVRTGNINGQSVVMPVAGQKDFSEIQLFVRSNLKDGYIVKENANITVLNGTISPGLAADKASQLRSYGYNVGTVTDAPTSDYQTTVIVDLTKGKMPYTKNYLEKRFGVKVVTKLPDDTIKPEKANFVIILGNNETINR